MAMTSKRAKLGIVASGAFAALGFFLAPPQWPAIGIAALCGVIWGFVFTASQGEDLSFARIFAQMLVFCGWFLAEHKFSVKHDGVVGFGAVLQYIGVAYVTGAAFFWVYLGRRNKKNTG